MNIYVTAYNPNIERNNHKPGIHKTQKNVDPGAYLLGYASKKERERIMYVPYKISYKTQIDQLRYIRRYLTKNKRGCDLAANSNLRHRLIKFLEMYAQFKKKYPDFSKNRAKLYKRPFKREKKRKKLIDGYWTTKYRTITEPKKDLKELQDRAHHIIIEDFEFLESEQAHGYVKGRSNISNAEPHQYSKHFLQLDLKNFFPSINQNLIKTRLHSLKEFAIIEVQDTYIDYGPLRDSVKKYKELVKGFIDALLDIAMYKGGLPQGSPLSPIITNMVMLSFDIEMQDFAKNKIASKSKIMFTRYADDLTFSSMYPISIKKIFKKINSELSGTKIKINREKTKYRVRGQKIFITGVKISGENKLTHGHKKNEKIKRDIFQAIMSVKEGVADVKENQILIGNINYAKMIQPKYIDSIIKKYCRKFNIQIADFYRFLVN